MLKKRKEKNGFWFSFCICSQYGTFSFSQTFLFLKTFFVFSNFLAWELATQSTDFCRDFFVFFWFGSRYFWSTNLACLGSVENTHVGSARNDVDCESDKQGTHCWIDGSKEWECYGKEPDWQNHWHPTDSTKQHVFWSMDANNLLPDKVKRRDSKPHCYELATWTTPANVSQQFPARYDDESRRRKLIYKFIQASVTIIYYCGFVERLRFRGETVSTWWMSIRTTARSRAPLRGSKDSAFEWSKRRSPNAQ